MTIDHRPSPAPRRALGACLAILLASGISSLAQERPERAANELLRRIVLGARRARVVHYDLRVSVPATETATAAQVTAEITVEGALAEPQAALQFMIIDTAKVRAARVGGVEVKAAVHPAMQGFPINLLEVTLPQPLERGGRLTVACDYDLPSTFPGPDGKPTRRTTDPYFGKDEIFTSLASVWYPGNLYDRYTCDLAFTVPAGIQVMASGVPVAETPESDGRVTFRFREEDGISVMNFFGARYQVHTTTEDGLTLALYALPLQQEVNVARILEDLRACFRFYEQRFGPSGLKRFAVVMASPTFEAASYNARHYAAIRPSYFQYHDRGGDEGGAEWYSVVAHETAHVWWGFRAQSDVLGNGGNWLREGLAEYSSILAVEARYGERLSAHWCHRHMLRYYQYVLDELGGHEPSLVDITYAMPLDTSYLKGAWLYRMLERLIGPEAWRRTLARYLEVAAQKMATWKTFAKIAAEESGQDLVPFFEKWLVGTGHLDLSVTTADAPARVIVTQQGDFPPESTPPFRVVATDAAGKRQEWTVRLPGAAGKLELPLEMRPVRVDVDPEDLLVDVERMNNRWPAGWDPGLATTFLTPPRLARALGTDTNECALLVVHVERGSPGERLGLKGSLITAIDGRPVRDPDALAVRCWDLTDGEKIDLTIRTPEGTKTVRVAPR